MRPIVFLLALAVSGSLQAGELPHCKVSVYSVSPAGKVSEKPILSPRHVLSLADAGKDVSGQHLWRVDLTPKGTAINSAYTKAHLGERLAVFCDSKEMVRPIIQSESSSEFMFATSEHGP